MEQLVFEKNLGAVEDLLLDATSPDTVTQIRAGQSVTVHKLNLNTIPAEGKLGEAGFKSLATLLTEMTADEQHIEAVDSNKGLALVVGDGGVTWDGGTPLSNELSIAQILSNGYYRWLLKGTAGSDNWQFRGRLAVSSGVNASDAVNKSQLDAVAAKAVQSDWNESSSSQPDYIKNKPTIPTAATTSIRGTVRNGTADQLSAGTDTEPKAWSAQDLQDFSQASGGNSSSSLGMGQFGDLYPDSIVTRWGADRGYYLSNGAQVGSITPARVISVGYTVMEAGTYTLLYSNNGDYSMTVSLLVNNTTVYSNDILYGTIEYEFTLDEESIVAIRLDLDNANDTSSIIATIT